MREIKFIIAVVVTVFLISCDHHPPILAGGEDSVVVDGVREKAKFGSIWPSGDIDSKGNLYVVSSNSIKKITPDGKLSTYSGSDKSGFQDGEFNQALFNYPLQLYLDNENNIFINDQGGTKIRKVTSGGKVSTIIGKDKYFETYSNNKLVKIDIGEFNLAGFDLNQNLYFSNNSIYYKLSKDNIIVEFPETAQIKDLYGSYFIGFNSKSLDLYFEYPDSYGDFDYYYKFNLTTSKITKLFTKKRSFTLQVIFTKDGIGYQLFDSKIFRVDENLNESKEIYSFYFTKNKEFNFGLGSASIVVDEKRNILYIIESKPYNRIYKLNLN